MWLFCPFTACVSKLWMDGIATWQNLIFYYSLVLVSSKSVNEQAYNWTWYLRIYENVVWTSDMNRLIWATEFGSLAANDGATICHHLLSSHLIMQPYWQYVTPRSCGIMIPDTHVHFHILVIEIMSETYFQIALATGPWNVVSNIQIIILACMGFEPATQGMAPWPATNCLQR